MKNIAIVRRRTMSAEMEPDCYGGASCDQIVPRWTCYADGDNDEDTTKIINLDARTFPPGTKIVITEPVCPDCGETRSIKYPPPEDGPLFAAKCSCGFDWGAWVLDNYS